VLTESSYLTAIYVYTGTALMALLYFAWCMRRRWSAAWIALVLLLGAALLMTPAFPREGVDTMAPALIVAGFALFTEGFEAAEHALRPLAAACGLAFVIAIILRFTLLRRRPEAAET